MPRNALASLLLLSLLSLAGCWTAAGPEVVAYTAMDSEFSEPIYHDFTVSTGIAVRAKFDTESTKTVGLAEAILAEKGRPRCDVFWNNEILNTLRLAGRGSSTCIAPRRPPVIRPRTAPPTAPGTASRPGRACCWSTPAWCRKSRGRAPSPT